MSKLSIRTRTKLNILLSIIGISLGAVLGIILTQNSPSPENQSSPNNPDSTVSEPAEVPIADKPIITDNSDKTPEIIEIDSNKTIGNKNAKVIIYEFSDFQCSFCRDYHQTTFLQISKNYIETNKVLYIFKDFPLPMHPQSTDAALAANCALEQNEFQKMQDLLFKNQNQWSFQESANDLFRKYATEINLDMEKYDNCLTQESISEKISADIAEGESKSVKLTPTFFINDKKVVGAQNYKTFADIIDNELAAGQPN